MLHDYGFTVKYIGFYMTCTIRQRDSVFNIQSS